MLSVLEQRLVEREMELLSDADLVRWARAVIHQDDVAGSDPDIAELASLQFANPRLVEARTLLRGAVVRANPQFDLKAPTSQAHGRAAFVELCRRFLSDDLRPYELCRLVAPIERTFDYPDWLGDFFNHCDWCEPESTRSHLPGLVEYVTQFVATSSDVEP